MVQLISIILLTILVMYIVVGACSIGFELWRVTRNRPGGFKRDTPVLTTVRVSND